MKKKNKIVIIMLTEEEDRIIKELRQKHSINISNLVREFIGQYYNKTIKKI